MILLDGFIEIFDPDHLDRDPAAEGPQDAAYRVGPGSVCPATVDHNLSLLKWIEAFSNMRLKVLVGPSRKSFIGKLDNGADEAHRLGGTIAACLAAMRGGASMVRVHDVAPVVQAIRVADAIESAAGNPDPARG